jgi:NADPH:quinone reductase-like Zn-dependent oxidoreductase
MKSYHASSGVGLSGLILREGQMPTPGPNEALIRVRANSLNYRKILVLRGTYPLPVKPAVVMGSDGAGEVIAIGSSVTRVKVRDRVAAAMFPRWHDGPITWEYATQLGGTLDGMMAEYVTLSEEGLVPLPDHLSFEEGATLPCAAVTAWSALAGARRLQAGDTVLTLGSGGVSLFAVQFAKLFGARVIATTSSGEKAERLRALGLTRLSTTGTWPTGQMRCAGSPPVGAWIRSWEILAKRSAARPWAVWSISWDNSARIAPWTQVFSSVRLRPSACYSLAIVRSFKP